MNMARTIIGAVVISALAFSATPAFAEFKSVTEETKGKGEVVELTLEAGGATVTCEALEELASAATWTILKEGTASTKGPDLQFSIGKWGKCTFHSLEVESASAEITACDLEMIEPGEEEKVKGKIAGTTCTIKALSCELKLEPLENESLTSLRLMASGENDGNMVVEPTVTNLTTTTKGVCPGVSSSKEGKLKGLVEATQVQPGDIPEFAIWASRLFLRETNNTATVTIARRFGGPSRFVNFTEVTPISFTRQEPASNECVTLIYTSPELCSYNVTYNALLGVGAYSLQILGLNGVWSDVVIRGI